MSTRFAVRAKTNPLRGGQAAGLNHKSDGRSISMAVFAISSQC
jgi:hypothetical protein